MSLNNRQQAFVQEYLIDLNATQAAIRAGYSAKTAAEQGYDLLRKPQVQAAVSAALKEREKETKINAGYVLRGAAELFERCMQKTPVMYFDRVEKEYAQETATIVDEDSGEVREVGVWKFDATGAAAALNILGKHVDIQAFKEKQEVEHKGKVVYEIPEKFKDDESWEQG
jgi:phage terminase small subunit